MAYENEHTDNAHSPMVLKAQLFFEKYFEKGVEMARMMPVGLSECAWN